MGLICTPYGYSGAAKVSGLATYQSTILADKPVGYWPLNETSGTVANDLSGNGFNMAYQNAPTLAAAAIAPGLGKSVLLNGSNQFVELASPPMALQIVEGSFEAWANLSSVPTADGHIGAFLTNEYESSAPENLNFCLGFSGTMSGASPASPIMAQYNNAASQWNAATGSAALLSNTPYHILGTYDGSSLKIYINGQLSGSGTGQNITPTTHPILIGQGDLGGFLPGLISNVAMYNTVLTAQQVLNHYNAGIA